MIIYKDLNINNIIKYLDDKFPDLNGMHVLLMFPIYNFNKDSEKVQSECIMNLLHELIQCGCAVSIIGDYTDIGLQRNIFSNSDIVICDLPENSINQTFHPKYTSLIIDLNGKSVSSCMKCEAQTSSCFTIQTKE